MVNIKIEGVSYQVEEGLTILEAAKKCGYEIPSLCAFNHGECSNGSCRVCLVEVKGARGLVASCVYPVNEGMEIIISSPKDSSGLCPPPPCPMLFLSLLLWNCWYRPHSTQYIHKPAQKSHGQANKVHAPSPGTQSPARSGLRFLSYYSSLHAPTLQPSQAVTHEVHISCPFLHPCF